MLIEDVQDAYLLKLARHEDGRGYFEEVNKYGEWPQVNISSSKKGVLRGIHCSPYPKLVTCVQGAVWDVVVDLRKSSPTFLQHFGVRLSEAAHQQLYVPANCGHSFLSLYDDSILLYLQGDLWTPESDRCYRYNDPAFGINWPFTTEPIVSEKDRHAFLVDTHGIN